MRRTYSFVKSIGRVRCKLPGGDEVEVPVVPGILKHPRPEALPELLKTPGALVKYTVEAMRRAPWSVLREFPRLWLVECMDRARLSHGRRMALEFLLADPST